MASKLVLRGDRAQISLSLATHHVFAVSLLLFSNVILLPLDRLLNVTGRPQLLIVVFRFGFGDHISRATLVVERLARESRGDSGRLVACATEGAAPACCPELRYCVLGRCRQSRQPPLDTRLRVLDW